MSTSAFAVIIVSTFMHAGWNLMVRHGRNEVRFMERMVVAWFLIGLVPLIACEITMVPLGAEAVRLSLIAGCCGGVYFFGLAKGYESSDFTIVYPVVRTLPVLLIAVADLIMGHVPTVWGWLGIVLVVFGCFLAPLRSIRDLHPRAYMQRTILWMVLAAFGTVGYSLVDKQGSDLLASRVRLPVEAIVPAIRYTGYYFLSATPTLLLLVRLRPQAGRRHDTGMGWSIPALAGVFNFVAYAMIVWVYQASEKVSYVVACRQFSIVIGVVAAFVIFHEPGRWVRAVAVVLITMGLFVIGIWG